MALFTNFIGDRGFEENRIIWRLAIFKPEKVLALVAHWSFMLRFGSINSLLYNIRIQCFHRSGIIFRQNFFEQMKSIDKLLQNSNDEKIVGDIVLCDFRSFFLFLVRMTSTNRGVAAKKLIVFPFYTGTVCVSELNIFEESEKYSST